MMPRLGFTVTISAYLLKYKYIGYETNYNNNERQTCYILVIG